MEFLNNAMEIEIYTRRKCKRFPKTERFTTSARLIGLAAEAAGYLSRGNDIYPATQHDAQRRRAHFMDARGVYADMIREVEVCCRVDGINMDILPAWMAMIAKEITLINGNANNNNTTNSNGVAFGFSPTFGFFPGRQSSDSEIRTEKERRRP